MTMKNVIAEYMKQMASLEDDMVACINELSGKEIIEIGNALGIYAIDEYYEIECLDDFFDDSSESEEELEKYKQFMPDDAEWFRFNRGLPIFYTTEEMEDEIRSEWSDYIADKLCSNVDSYTYEILPAKLRNIVDKIDDKE